MPYTFTDKDIIGKGGMGCVYKGLDPNGRTVAIKMMSNKVTCYPEYRELFNGEVETLRCMDNPSVVHIVGEPFGDAAGNLYLPMEFVDGKTLEHYIKEHGKMSEQEAISLMGMILDAMQYVHDQNCIHRDIKPSNIMLRNDRDRSICIIDFGIAKDAAVGSTGKTVGRIIGTDGYMSPEQAAGLNIDKRTDIYSLGCVLFFILTGKPAIEKKQNSYDTINAILKDQIPSPSEMVPGVSKGIDDVFRKAVDKNMVLRFQSAKEFKEALPDISNVNHRTHLIETPTVRVGRAANNDMQISNEYVSGLHLVIRGLKKEAADGTGYQLEVEDTSSNGTGMDGRRIHKQTVVIDYTSTAMLPQLLLAGRGDCPLDWAEVVSRLKRKGWMVGSHHPVPPRPQPKSDELGCLLTLVSFLFPIIGWILWGVWKDQYHAKAAAAAKWAWIGFAVGVVYNIIVFIILSI